MINSTYIHTGGNDSSERGSYRTRSENSSGMCISPKSAVHVVCGLVLGLALVIIPLVITAWAFDALGMMFQDVIMQSFDSIPGLN